MGGRCDGEEETTARGVKEGHKGTKDRQVWGRETGVRGQEEGERNRRQDM